MELEDLSDNESSGMQRCKDFSLKTSNYSFIRRLHLPDIKHKSTDSKKILGSSCLLKIKSKILRALIPIALLTLFNSIYLMSLKGCHQKDREICGEWFKNHILVLVGLTVLSSLEILIFFICIFKRMFCCKWSLVVILNMVVLLIYDHSTTYNDHGLFNFALLAIFLFVYMLDYFLFKLIVFICSKNCKYIFIACVVMIILSIYIYFKYVFGSCDGWEKGIGNTQLQNLANECIIVKPNYCELSIRDGWFDLNRFTQECANRKMLFMKKHLNITLQNNRDLKKIGYPRLEKLPNKAKNNEKYFKEEFGNRYIDMDDPNISQNIKENIEFTLDVSNSDSHILQVELKKNETRAEEAIKLRQKTLEDDKAKGFKERNDKDGLIIYFDNISRANFRMKMKRLDRYISGFAYNSYEEGNANLSINDKNNSTDFQTPMKAFEFFKYRNTRIILK